MSGKFSIISLGCPRNLVDSEIVVSRLIKKGYSQVDIKNAKIILINTCAFIEDAKKESIAAILEAIELKKKASLNKIIVFGCLVQRYKTDLLSEFKDVDAFVGRIELDDNCIPGDKLTPKPYAYLKISEGCINRCSYCIIPKIKGRLVSRSVKSILKEVKSLDKAKIREINLIGQDITSFGLRGQDLTFLLKKISKDLKYARWIRLLYLHPRRINNSLLEEISNNDKICKYIDLPVQHINDKILKAMNRRTTKEEILSLIARIRTIIPNVAIRTSLIVGFPGETDEEFQELVEFVKTVRFNRLGVFKYSQEECTSAFNLTGQVPEKVKQSRFNTIMKLQKSISFQLNKLFIGKQLDILIEEKSEDGFLGRTEFDAPEIDGAVYIKTKNKFKIGQIVKGKIIDALEYDLIAEVK